MVTLYSHSKLSTFEQCQLKFKFKYIDKLVPDIKQVIEGFLGNRVHDILEWVYNEAKEKKSHVLDEVLQRYAFSWNQKFSSEIKIVSESMKAEDYFNLGIKFLIDYYVSNFPFFDETIETEKKIVIKLDPDNNYLLEGYIDRLVHHKKTNIFEIHDYKTGNFLKSQEDLDKDRQLALYSIGVRESYPDVKDVHLIWHFLAFNKKMTSKRSLEQLEKLRENIFNLILKIETAKEFFPNPGILCKWCEFRSYCPVIKNSQESLYSSKQTLNDYE